MSNNPATQFINPFVGLRAFEESEDYLFFGRGKEIDQLLKKFNSNRFLAVIGSSGSGKSSLVKSGLLPSIFSGFMTVGNNWRVALMQPGENPIGYLSRGLAQEGTLHTGTLNSRIPYESIIEASLRRSENGLVQVYKDAHLPPTENLLIVVDQFEELFRFSKYEKENKLGKSDAMHFIRILLTAVQQQECPIYVLLTMRSDFLGDCAEFRGLPEAINKGQYLVPRMTRDEIREAITGPIAVSNATISSRLLTRVLNDINNDTDQLPILQHAMMRTWDAWYKRKQFNTPIDFEDYEKIGTMKDSLSQHADEAYSELTSDKDQKTCELMFKALTDKSADVRGIRRPRSITDLCLLTGGTKNDITREVEIFRKPGRTFLMPPPGVGLTDHSIIDISHESLMRVWKRLVKWTEEEARSGDIYMRLANSAVLNEQGQRGFLQNPELEIVLKWKEQNNPTLKWSEGYKADFEKAMAYLENSRQDDLAEKKLIADNEAEERRKKRRRVIFALILLSLFGLMSTGLFVQSYIAERKARREAAAATDSLKIVEKERIKAAKEKKDADSTKEKLLELLDNLQKTNLSIDTGSKPDSIKILMAKIRIAIQKEKEATNERDRVIQWQTKTLRVIDTIRALNLKNAASEYVRLISEGPSDDNHNRKEFYGNKYFLAYNYHFKHLEKLLDAKDLDAYKSEENKLYYNNDVYKRVCEDFDNLKLSETVIKRDDTQSYDGSKSFGNANDKITLRKNDAGAYKILNLSEAGKNIAADTLSKPGQEFVCFTANQEQKLIFCSTNDNLIYVFNDKLQRVDTIAMAARVTALGSNNSGNTVYFGTSGGYIGYIDYRLYKKKNQPVFENKLESEITAIQLFAHNDNPAEKEKKSFLLAVAKTNGPKVYRLDENNLKPDRHLVGNELRYSRKVYGDIQEALFDDKTKRVILFTTKGTYSWNPFTYELLKILEEKRSFERGTKSTNDLINSPDVKKY